MTTPPRTPRRTPRRPTQTMLLAGSVIVYCAFALTLVGLALVVLDRLYPTPCNLADLWQSGTCSQSPVWLGRLAVAALIAGAVAEILEMAAKAVLRRRNRPVGWSRRTRTIFPWRMTAKTERPQCPDCGDGRLTCRNCDDQRPTAEHVWPGWKILSPFDRWETIDRIDQANPYASVLIWTEESGPEQPWKYPRWRHLDAIAPPLVVHGKPEIRVVDYPWRDSAIYAAATIDTSYAEIVSGDGILVQASPLGKGKGWEVVHSPGGGPQVVIHRDSKAQARAEVHRLAREYARKFKVKLTLASEEKP